MFVRCAFVFLLIGCGGSSVSDAGSDAGPAVYPPERLSGWGLFEDAAHQEPVDGVVPYDLISPLFSDYAIKHRFIRLPEGGRMIYTDTGVWQFPVGTAIVKSFGFPADPSGATPGERLIETRIIALEDDGMWHPYVYMWNDAMTEAELHQVGAQVPVEIAIDGMRRTFNYRVPDVFQCANCHGGVAPTQPIGPRTEQLDRDFDFGAGMENQIDHFETLGMFTNAVPATRVHLASPTDTSASIEARARAYLDANCAHCHRDGGAAQQSGLWLNAFITDEAHLGFCKRPVAAGAGSGGRTYDIVPGRPEESVMTFRMASETPGIKMPELPNVISHADGVALITEWIASLTPPGCM
jgi:uncharacterized repeat protein (TIGR03806 family)